MARKSRKKKNLPVPLQIATTLSSVWGILLLLISVAFIIPMFDWGIFSIIPFLPLLLGVLYMVSAHKTRNRKRSGAIFNFVLFLPNSLLLILFRFRIMPAGIAITLISILIYALYLDKIETVNNDDDDETLAEVFS